MRDFLIDTNIWEYWFNEKKQPQHANVLRRVHELEMKEGGSRVWISSITWGELEYGYQVQRDGQASLETPFRKFISDKGPKEFPVDRHVTGDYGRVRALLFEKYGRRTRKKKGLRPEQLTHPENSLQLQIQENDLWIVAQAISRNLTLVTNDKNSMRPLIDVAGDELHVENWAE